MLDRAVALLSRQEEFARSRLKLQSRYHHVLVDEFQDTSRQQWRLIELLIDAWSEGEGPTDAPTSIFVVGDRKQSIYRFRQAEVALLDEAARKIGVLAGRSVGQAIQHSFRAVPELLAFVNALGRGRWPGRRPRTVFRYDDDGSLSRRRRRGRRASRRRAGARPRSRRRRQAASAAALAAEIERLLATATVRDRHAAPRPARPDDIAILFRTPRRAPHRRRRARRPRHPLVRLQRPGVFRRAGGARTCRRSCGIWRGRIPICAAAEWLRSRFVRLSDDALARLAPDFCARAPRPGLGRARRPAAGSDRRARSIARAARRAALDCARRQRDAGRRRRYASSPNRRTPGSSSGRRLDQARENVKKVRALVRRVENRGYATLDRLAVLLRTLARRRRVERDCRRVGLRASDDDPRRQGPRVPDCVPREPASGRRAARAHRRHRARHAGRAARRVRADRRDRGRGAPATAKRCGVSSYVAATRARDRLYLGGDLDGRGRLSRRPSSLASLLPRRLPSSSARAPTPVRRRSNGRPAARPSPSASAGRPPNPCPPGARVPDVPGAARRRAAVAAGPVSSWPTASQAAAAPAPDRRGAAEAGDEPGFFGTLVHRLSARDSAAGEPERRSLRRRALVRLLGGARRRGPTRRHCSIGRWTCVPPLRRRQDVRAFRRGPLPLRGPVFLPAAEASRMSS